MEQYQNSVSTVFHALADPTRRAVIGRLGSGPASISDLAQPFSMALPSFMKHIRLLEESGLIVTAKRGRVRICAVEKSRLAVLDTWLADQRALWEGRADRLERFVTQETNDQTNDQTKDQTK